MVPFFGTSRNRRHSLFRRVSSALTDLSYLLAAAFPGLQRLLRWWAIRRYVRLAGLYARVVEADAAYFVPLTTALPDLPAAAVIVEVGAGTGAATNLLRQRYPQAAIAAVDLSPSMLARLATARARVLAGDAYALPVRDAVADLVLVHNAPFSLRELFRVARAGGIAVVILSGAGWIPAPVSRWLIGRAASPAAGAPERRAEAGSVWVFQR